jgi:hypothetical protein
MQATSTALTAIPMAHDRSVFMRAHGEDVARDFQ